ncbi:14637_t:CDS:1, partial [Gigaspora rosea]
HPPFHLGLKLPVTKRCVQDNKPTHKSKNNCTEPRDLSLTERVSKLEKQVGELVSNRADSKK